MNVFQEIIENITSRHVYIQTHNFPDPDAIASAYGLMALLQKNDIDASICYKGKIERFSTNGFINRLGIELVDLDTITLGPEDKIILVDSQRGNSNIIDTDAESIICIDHHPTFAEGAHYRYADIRPEYGACATIIASYYFENDIEMDSKVATALLYGIKNDTMGLSRGVSVEDVNAYQKLYSKCDLELIKSLEHCSLKYDDLKAYATAINSIKIFDKVSFANTGYDCPEALIATISDFMIDIAEVEFSVVYSIRDDGIKLSVRSLGTLDAGVITNEALNGIGGGGGHAEMAGGFVPFGDKMPHDDIELAIGTLEQRFLEQIH